MDPSGTWINALAHDADEALAIFGSFSGGTLDIRLYSPMSRGSVEISPLPYVCINLKSFRSLGILKNHNFVCSED